LERICERRDELGDEARSVKRGIKNGRDINVLTKEKKKESKEMIFSY
jgi:hypothetical protein